MPQPLLGFGISQQAALSHHLQYNHFPPVDPRWVPIAQAAIDLAAGAAELVTYENDEGGLFFDDEALKVLDEQVGQGKTAQEVLDGLHLWPFVEYALAEREGDIEPKAGE